MQTHSFVALVGFIAWTLALLILMEAKRGLLVMRGEIPPNRFLPDNANLSAFMQRLARAHANCIEGLPVFGGLLLVAIATGSTAITDPLAFVLLGARVFQSTVHMLSISPAAAMVRFGGLAVQLAIAVYWVWRMLLA